jgi:thymidylate synthase
MFRGLQSNQSCGKAWVEACQSIIATKDEGYNVVIDVVDAVHHDGKDDEVITLVNDFLSDHDANPIVTVANTIFPQSLYDEYGASRMVEEYRKDFDKFAHDGGYWGQYFDRMTRFEDPEDGEIDPLQELIEKMKGNEDRNTRYKAAYELTIYNPATDRKRHYGGPCLSYLSFKRHPDDGLLLTAVYRNHFYVSRLLGNLIGLGQLQAFVAKEAGVPVGSLTVVSTHAEMDTEGSWGIVEARKLVKSAAEIYKS